MNSSAEKSAPPVRIAGLISGGGRTLLNLLDAIDDGRLNAEVAIAISSNPRADGVARLQQRGVNVRCPQRDDHDSIDAILHESGTQLICLCGYLRHLRIHPDFDGRVVNVHPALLPKFGGKGMYGDRVHAAVLASGDTESGCTIHYVDGIYDNGPVILQRHCPVLPNDTVDSLAARVFREECVAYPAALAQIIDSMTLSPRAI